MKRAYLSLAAVVFSASVALAQDAYDAGNLTTTDLNGTARYIGMGGALEALGADLSTISTNPAGVGMFRRSQVTASMSVVSQQDAVKFGNTNKTNMSFDQIGFVWANQTGAQSYINFGFNYHKSRNFNQILAASNRFAPSYREVNNNGELVELRGSSITIPTNIKGLGGLFDSSNADSDGRNYYETQLDSKFSNLLMFDNGDGTSSYYPLTAESFDFRQGHTGYIGQYDFNLSGNAKDRIYWGFTMGLHDVHYDAVTAYNETLESGQYLPNGNAVTNAGIKDERSIRGQGVDLRAGIIVRPIEESAFRFGLHIATPTWYTLTTDNYTTAYADIEDHEVPGEHYKFKFNTPWQFGLSLGHTMANCLALGASYEFSDYGTADMRYITYSGYDGDESRSDSDMKSEIGAVLRGVHTAKVGMEYRPDPAIAVRLGYNYVSPVYQEGEYRNQTIYSPGVYYASTQDYTNWKATHRITAGIGTKINKFSLDLAYQYSVRNGDFYPFVDDLNYEEPTGFYMENTCKPTEVNFKRHQVLLTLGYTF